jgi:hypothetical protein
MNKENKENRALALLESIKPDLLKILENAPPYGSCGMELWFHDSEITRFIMKAEVSKKSLPQPIYGIN